LAGSGREERGGAGACREAGIGVRSDAGGVHSENEIILVGGGGNFPGGWGFLRELRFGLDEKSVPVGILGRWLGGGGERES